MQEWRFEPTLNHRAWGTAAAVGSGIVAVDQLSKSIALDALGTDSVHVVGPLHLRIVFNKGAAFGLGQGFSPYVFLAVLAVLVVWLFRQRRVASWLSRVATASILAGAVSNAVDRLFRSHDGAVVDFIDLRWWPVFNFADCAIVVGMVLLVWANRREVFQ